MVYRRRFPENSNVESLQRPHVHGLTRNHRVASCGIGAKDHEGHRARNVALRPKPTLRVQLHISLYVTHYLYSRIDECFSKSATRTRRSKKGRRGWCRALHSDTVRRKSYHFGIFSDVFMALLSRDSLRVLGTGRAQVTAVN